jgi:peptidoglycan hydrolase-like protein with peptidoglycan-binding domain
MATQPGAGRERLTSVQIREMQQALKQAGHDPGRADGVMGPRTTEALRAYQREQNLKTEAEAMQRLGVTSSSDRASGRQSMRRQ